MVFVPTDRLDETWAFVLRQLAGGALAANEAKVPPTAGTTDREKPLLVYCDDWEDRAEVLRVGLQLWKALEGCSATGFARNGALNFKTDECAPAPRLLRRTRFPPRATHPRVTPSALAAPRASPPRPQRRA